MLENWTFSNVLKKVQKTVESCKTKEQLKVAKNYSIRLIKIYCRNELKNKNNFEFGVHLLNVGELSNEMLEYLSHILTQRLSEIEIANAVENFNNSSLH